MTRRLGLGLALAAFAAMPGLAKDTPPKTDPKIETLHVVQAGETLAGIANRAEVPRVLIIEANHLKAPYAVKAGQKLVIPRRRSHTVEMGETTFDIAMKYGVPWDQIATANSMKSGAKIKPGQWLVIPTLGPMPAVAATAAEAAMER